ncbi:hypothetical protein PG987_005947 [Apiospora arundinis]
MSPCQPAPGARPLRISHWSTALFSIELTETSEDLKDERRSFLREALFPNSSGSSPTAPLWPAPPPTRWSNTWTSSRKISSAFNVAPENDEDNHDTEDADEEEYQEWLENHEHEWDIYMGRHQMNPKEDNEMSGVMSKLEM